MTGFETAVRSLARRAESTAGFGSAGDDAELETDLEAHLRREAGAGWDMATSRSLDPNGRSSVREAAWWLAARGVDIFALHAASVDAVGAAIDHRLGIDAAAPGSDGLTNHGIDIVAHDAAGETAYLVQVTSADLDELDDVSAEPLRSLVRADLWLSADDIEIVPAVVGPESAFGVVERESDDDDEQGSGGHRVRRTDPPGERGPAPEDVTFAPAESDLLRAVPPCDGAIAGVAAMELLRERTAAEDGSKPSTQESILRRVEAELDVGGLRERFTTVIAESSHFSRVKAGRSRYVYLNPGGVVTAAALRSRLGDSVSTTDAMDAMRDSKQSIGQTLAQVEQQVQAAKRRAPGRPYGVLPDLFDDRTDR